VHGHTLLCLGGGDAGARTRCGDRLIRVCNVSICTVRWMGSRSCGSSERRARQRLHWQRENVPNWWTLFVQSVTILQNYDGYELNRKGAYFLTPQKS
jgi:hypothetical protein